MALITKKCQLTHTFLFPFYTQYIWIADKDGAACEKRTIKRNIAICVLFENHYRNGKAISAFLHLPALLIQLLIGVIAMDKKTVRYNNDSQIEFVQELRKNVNEYFKQRGISTYGNYSMVLKTVFMFSVFLVPYFVMILGWVTQPILLFLLWVTMGVGSAGIGLSIMHDANHKSYSKNKWVNKFLSYSLSLLGGAPVTWQYQHNTLHHSFTNIDGLDEDINPPKFLRFSPNVPRYKIHKFQYLYAWVFYGLMTITWTVDKDFRQVYRYKQKYKDFTKNRSLFSILIEVLFTKVLYYAYILVLPILILPVPWWMILIFYFAMHFTCGLILGIIFQTAHVMPDTEFPKPNEDGTIENNWAIHQLLTTTNYSPRSKIFSWLIGGLNYQVEHHLFPRICHIHYNKIALIVRETALKFNLPYHVQDNFVLALSYHTKMLKSLGK